MSFKMKWNNDFEKRLNQLSEDADKISGDNQVPFEDLFNQQFMWKYTEFDSILEFVNESGFDFTNMESINESELDAFIEAHTSFSSWEDMKGKAAKLWITKQLGF